MPSGPWCCCGDRVSGPAQGVRRPPRARWIHAARPGRRDHGHHRLFRHGEERGPQACGGLLQPDAGDVIVDGRAVSTLDRAALTALRREIGFVFQFAALFDSMSVFDNVALGLRRRDLSDDEIAARVREALALVDLTGAEERYPAELSGGMRKRVGIARAIALRPRYILYDEPTTGLDPVTSAVIDQLMMRTREHLRVTGIVVTHDMRSAYTVGDRIAMLYEGKIRQVGTVAQIQETEDPVVRQFS